eukprot:5127201-Alexandrium_andersonii.AAC.1
MQLSDKAVATQSSVTSVYTWCRLVCPALGTEAERMRRSIRLAVTGGKWCCGVPELLDLTVV